MSSEQTDPLKAAAAIERLLAAGHAALVVQATAELGLADHLDDKPRDVQSLAQATATHIPSLARLLRALAAIGIVHETNDRRYSLTPLGAALRTNGPGSMRARARLYHDEWIARPWQALPHAVRTGELAFHSVFGTDQWTYLSRHPESSLVFDEAQRDMTQGVNAAVMSSYPFGDFKSIVDVGGGIGSLLLPILERNPEMRGIILDLPHVARRAQERIAAAGLTSRCEAVPGDALIAVPPGADAYVLKSLLHGHDDENALAILRKCRSAMPRHGKLIVIERILPERVDAGDEKALGWFLSDLSMMLVSGARERTEREYQHLLAEADLRLNRAIPTRGPSSIMEAVPA